MADSTIRARIRVDDQGRASVRTMISHPMHPEQRDPATGAKQAAHIIETVEVALNGERVLNLELGQGVSANPLLSFVLNDVSRGDTLAIAWRDSKGAADSATFTAA